MMKIFIKKLGVVLFLLCLAVVVYTAQAALDRHRTIEFVDRRPVFLPRGEVLKWLSMGYRGLVGDWLWIRCVLYYGRRIADEDNPYFNYARREGTLQDNLEKMQESSSLSDSIAYLGQKLQHILYQHESRGLVEYIYPMLERVTTVDPHFVFPYVYGGVYILIDTGELKAAQDLLRKGYLNNPGRWEFPFYLGWIEWMYKGELEKTHRYLLEAVSKDACPDYVERLMTGLTKNLNVEEMTRLYLESLVESTDNPDIRERIQHVLARFPG